MSGRSGVHLASHSDSFGQETLDVVQRRLQAAEDDTRHLVEQLSLSGFGGSRVDATPGDGARTPTNGRQATTKVVRFQKTGPKSQETIPPFKATTPAPSLGADDRQDYDVIVGRMCRMESAIQTLKLSTAQAQTERDIWRKEAAQAKEKLAAVHEAFDAELHTLRGELEDAKQAAGTSRKGEQDAQDRARQTQTALEEVTSSKSEYSIELGDLRVSRQKLTRRVAELKAEVTRESSLRASLELSHNTLLQRIKDMEGAVDSERLEVKAVASNCVSLKHESEEARDALQQGVQIRAQLERNVLQKATELQNSEAKIRSLEDEKHFLMSEVHKIQQQYIDLHQQIDLMKGLVEDKQSTHEQLEKENKQLYEAMKSAATQNAQLIAKFEEELEAGRAERAGKLQREEEAHSLREQLRTESRQKAQAQQKCAELQKNLEDLQADLVCREGALQRTVADLQAEVTLTRDKLRVLQTENENALRDKEKLLEEVNGTVDAMAERRSDLERDLEGTRLELEAARTARTVLEEENGRLLERVAGLEDNQSSQKHVEQTMTDMMEQKNRLAYEKGRLQTKVDQLQGQLETLATAQTDLSQLRRNYAAMEAKLTKTQSEQTTAAMSTQRAEAERNQWRAAAERREQDFQLAIKARDEAVTEALRVKNQVETLQDREKNKVYGIQQNVMDARQDNKKMAATLESVMTSHSRLQTTLEELQVDLGKKDALISSLTGERDEAQTQQRHLQKELDSLHARVSTVEDLEASEVKPLRSSLQKCKEDNSKMARHLESLLRSTAQLQSESDRLQDDVQKKDHLLKQIKDARRKDEELHKQEVRSYEERLSAVRLELVKERERSLKKTNKEVAEIKRDHDATVGKNGGLSRANTELRRKVSELEYQAKEQKNKMAALRGQVDRLQKLRHQQEQTVGTMQHVMSQLSDLEKTKTEYVKKNKQQAKLVQDFMEQISGLQSEIQTLARAHVDTADIVQRQEDELGRQRRFIDDLKQKYKDSKRREETLERLRKETEHKLREANNESLQISTNLQDAHGWFKSKFDDLQVELTKAKMSHTECETQKYESQRMIEQEKQQAEDMAERARLMIQSSRETVSRLADHAQVAQRQTREQMVALQQQLDRERGKALQAERKMTELKESSFRHTEELARELDSLKAQSWNYDVSS